MSFKDDFKVTGEVTIQRYNENQELVETKVIPNLVVTAGKTFIASRIAGTAAGVMSHMGVGSTNTAATLADTDLAAVLGSRIALSVSGGTASTNQVTYAATFGAGVSTGAWVEAGIFNASTVGTMLCRTVFGTITKNAGDSITVTWVLSIN